MSAPPFGTRVPGNAWHGLDATYAPRLVSVVVVHHEQDRELRRTLTALRRQDYPGDRLEVIVVDDGSRRVPDVPDGVRLLCQERRGARRSAARNRGAAASRGEVLCFLDADTTPEREYVQRLARLPSLTPEAVVVGRRRHARLDAVDPAVDVAVAGPSHELPAPAWLRDGYCATRDLRDAGPGSYRYIISAVLGCTRWFFDELGGFDEEFLEYGGEDWEWAHRAWLRGAVFAHVPGAVAWHDGPDWATREATMDARRAQKSSETIRLAQLITADGHSPRGLFGRRAPIAVELGPEFDGPAAFICVDSLLEALPRAAVRVSDDLAPLFTGDPRVVAAGDVQSERLRWPQLHLTVHVPVQVSGPDLAALCAAVTSAEAEAGACRVRDAEGMVMTIESARYRARVDHWGAAAARVGNQLQPSWLRRLPPAPDVEAYLGGWAGT